MAFRKLDDGISVSPQLSVDDVADAAGAGFVLIINNRPDGEAPDEPQGGDIEAAARAQGLDYCAIPIGHGGFSQPQVDTMAEQLQRAGGPVLAYCRSGTRSTLLWSLARAKLGDPPAELNAKANAAGYDLTPVAALIDMLANRG
jgi:uncharacterized protein (TIGR01244 family)